MGADSAQLVRQWMKDGFVVDDISSKMANIQRISFLRTGEPPADGQRVELSLMALPCPTRLSGKVAEVKPKPDDIHPLYAPMDKNGSMMLTNCESAYIRELSGAFVHTTGSYSPGYSFLPFSPKKSGSSSDRKIL